MRDCPQRPAPDTLVLDGALNDQQRAVVLAQDGPVLVIAGAGTGKTRTLAYRCAALIARGIDPRQLLLATFTQQAAMEMNRRVASLTTHEVHLAWAGTFHHIANRALRTYAPLVGLPTDYTVLDREDARDLLSACLMQAPPRTSHTSRLGRHRKRRNQPGSQVLQRIASTALAHDVAVAEAIEISAPRFSQNVTEIEQILQHFRNRKRQLSLVDYDDLLVYFRDILVAHRATRETFTTTFRHVLVDEFQDTNRLQCDIIDLCASAHGNLTVVGDDAQSIYAFRGARIDNMLSFTERYPDAAVLTLEKNYRSTPEILAIANRSISFNIRQLPKTLYAQRASGTRPILLTPSDTSQQAVFVAQRAQELARHENFSFSQIAILFRSHAQSLEMQIELARQQIPFRVRSGPRFFEQAHIKDIVSFLRVAFNSSDVLAWQRVLRIWPGVGKNSAAVILELVLTKLTHLPRKTRRSAAELLGEEILLSQLPTRVCAALSELAETLRSIAGNRPLADTLTRILESHYRDYLEKTFSNTETRHQDIVELGIYASGHRTLEAFLSEISLAGGFKDGRIGGQSAHDDAVILGTIHRAKGLEWDAVFVLGLVEGRFPPAIAIRTDSALEEERRLFYVAVTRARTQLYLCCPRFEKSARGSKRNLCRSRFAEELLAGDIAPYEHSKITEG